MYDVGKIRAIYTKTNKLIGVLMGDQFFEATPLKVWFGNIRRRMFVLQGGKTPLYHYLDLREEAPQEWYSYDWEDYSGINRLLNQNMPTITKKAKEMQNGI